MLGIAFASCVVSFLTQEDGKAEENMAQKRAALLEKRLRREKESQQRKMHLEAELEQKKEEARYVGTSVKSPNVFALVC